MYALKRVSLHNWYLFEAEDLEFTGAVGIVGPTGSGKSSLLDAIQTVLTGNNGNYLDLNPVAGEASDRTVLEYCLGCVVDVDNGNPQRDSAETTVVLTFQDDASGRHVAVGMMFLAAAAGSRLVERAMFVVRGCDFRIAEFVVQDDDGESMLEQDEILAHLKRRFGDDFEKKDNSVRFAEEFLGAMRPSPTPDARRFLSRFTNAMAAKEIQDPTDFVRRFVLDPSPLKIDRVRETIAAWRFYQSELERLEDHMSKLSEVRGRFATWARQHVRAHSERYVAVFCERLGTEHALTEFERERDDANERIERHGRIVENHRLSIKEHEASALRWKSMIAESDASSMASVVGDSKVAADRERTDAARDFVSMVRAIAGLSVLHRVRSRVASRLHGAVDASLALASAVSSLGKLDEDKVGSLVATAERTLSLLGIADLLDTQRDELFKEIALLDADILDLERRIGEGSGARTYLSSATSRFLRELEERGIPARSLPDVVDVSDASWAFSLEALLGAFREAVIVDPQHLDRAFDHLFRSRNQLHSCRLVHTRRVRARRANVRPGSIAEVATTVDADARAFIEQQVGHYQRAHTHEDLERLDHAIMRDGKTASGVGMRVHRDAEPLLGARAQAAARERASVELRSKRETRASLIVEREELSTALQAIARLGENVLERLTELESKLHVADLRSRDLAIQLANLDSPELRRMRAEADQAEKLRDEYQKELDDELRKKNEAEIAVGRINLQIEAARLRVGEKECEEEALCVEQESASFKQLIALSEPEHTIETMRDELLVHVAQRSGADLRSFLASTHAAALERAQTSALQASGSATRAVNAFNTTVVALYGQSPLADDATKELQFSWIVVRLGQLQNHELLPHRARVIEARAEVERSVKEDLLTKLFEKFEIVRSQLTTLNARLENFDFVGQRYSFRRRFEKSLKPIADLAIAVGRNPDRGLAILEGDDADTKLVKAMETIERIVSEQSDAGDLADYRKYFTFEMLFADFQGRPIAGDLDESDDEIDASHAVTASEVSKKIGKMSGGQRQAPYYVAIAASMVVTYYPGGARGGDTNGMGLVLFDEAFNKLDVPNTQGLINFYKKLGLQVLVAAPEEKRASFLECVDSIVTVSRPQNTTMLYVDTSVAGSRAIEEMRRANPEHAGVEAFRSEAAE
jgi:uncharacterized protein YPO0396